MREFRYKTLLKLLVLVISGSLLIAACGDNTATPASTIPAATSTPAATATTVPAVPATTAPALPAPASPTVPPATATTAPTATAPVVSPTAVNLPPTQTSSSSNAVSTAAATSVAPPVKAVPPTAAPTRPVSGNGGSKPVTTAATNPASQSQTGFLAGTVVFGPACPPSAEPDEHCLPAPGRPVSGQSIVIKDQSGARIIKTVTTDSKGGFQAELPAGTYQVTIASGGSSQVVNIIAGQTARLVLNLTAK